MQTAEDYGLLSQHLLRFPDNPRGAPSTPGLPWLLPRRRVFGEMKKPVPCQTSGALKGALVYPFFPPLLIRLLLAMTPWTRKEGEQDVTDVLLTLFALQICLTLSDVFLLHFRLSSYTSPPPLASPLPPRTPPPPHTHEEKKPTHCFRSGCQSALLIFKGSGAWNRDSEHGPDFLFSDLPLSFPSISVSLAAFLCCVFLISGLL